MKNQKNTASAWRSNILFAAVILLLAAVLALALGLRREREAETRPEKLAVLTYGNAERMETEIDLREDGYFTFASGGYEIHLRVEAGTIAFVDSPCPDHLCESFGQLDEVYDWAACMPAQAIVTIVSTEERDAK